MTGRWMSKAAWAGRSHFVLDASGTTACAYQSGPRGIRMGVLFKTGWVARRPADHPCRLCAKLTKAPDCACGRCSVTPIKAAYVPSADARRLLVHMNETGGYIPGDPIKVSLKTFTELVGADWITVERDGAAFLTAAGRAGFRWTVERKAVAQ